MRIAQEEIFGPVRVVIPYEDDEDAVRLANDSIYGLGGAVFGSHQRAMDICKRIRAGALSVNGGMSITGDLPFGGYKQSGVGREWGLEGIEEFTEIKAIGRSEEHTSELQSLMRISYAVFCLKKKHKNNNNKEP